MFGSCSVSSATLPDNQTTGTPPTFCDSGTITLNTGGGVPAAANVYPQHVYVTGLTTELCVTGWLLEVCVTVGVRVTRLLGALVNEGFRVEVTVVEVPAAAPSVMVIVPPEPMDPGESPAKLSKI